MCICIVCTAAYCRMRLQKELGEACLRGRKKNPLEYCTHNTFVWKVAKRIGGTLSLRSQKLSKYFLRGWKQIPSEYSAQSTSVSEVAQRIGGNVIEVAKRIRILYLRYLKIISCSTVTMMKDSGCPRAMRGIAARVQPPRAQI